MLLLTVEAKICNITHGVLDCPYDAVHEKLELRRRELKKGYVHGRQLCRCGKRVFVTGTDQGSS